MSARERSSVFFSWFRFFRDLIAYGQGLGRLDGSGLAWEIGERTHSSAAVRIKVGFMVIYFKLFSVSFIRPDRAGYLLPAGAEPILRVKIEAPPFLMNFSTAPTAPSTTQ